VPILAIGTLAIGAGPAYASTCTTSAQYGECYVGQTPVVQNNVWNAGADPGWSQTLTATTGYKWTVVANMANQSQVVSYPNSLFVEQQAGGPVPLSEYNTITSSWHIGLPAEKTNDGYEAAYDIWLGGGPGSSTGQEVMVWNDNYHETPAGSNTGVVWTDPDYGSKYDVWTNSGNATVSLVIQTNSISGSVDLLDLLNYVATHYSHDSVDTLAQIGYGFEIRSTSGTSETFLLYGFALSIN
jgi:hypothetical protein